MNQETTNSNWNNIKGEAKKLWGKLTDNDLMVAKGNIDKLTGRLQEVYGYSKERAQNEVESLKKRFGKISADATGKADDFVRKETETPN